MKHLFNKAIANIIVGGIALGIFLVPCMFAEMVCKLLGVG